MGIALSIMNCNCRWMGLNHGHANSGQANYSCGIIPGNEMFYFTGSAKGIENGMGGMGYVSITF